MPHTSDLGYIWRVISEARRVWIVGFAVEYGEYLIGVLVTCDSHDYHIAGQLITIITS